MEKDKSLPVASKASFAIRGLIQGKICVNRHSYSDIKEFSLRGEHFGHIMAPVITVHEHRFREFILWIVCKSSDFVFNIDNAAVSKYITSFCVRNYIIISLTFYRIYCSAPIASALNLEIKRSYRIEETILICTLSLETRTSSEVGEKNIWVQFILTQMAFFKKEGRYRI